MWWCGERVLAVVPADDGSMSTQAVAVIDVTDGTVITTVDTDLDIAFVG